MVGEPADRVRPIRHQQGTRAAVRARLHPAHLPRRAAPAPDSRVPTARLVIGEVGLPGVTTAFDALAYPESHAKILVDPHREPLPDRKANRADADDSGS